MRTSMIIMLCAALCMTGICITAEGHELSGLNCAKGEVPRWNGTAWECASGSDPDGMVIVHNDDDASIITENTAASNFGVLGAPLYGVLGISSKAFGVVGVSMEGIAVYAASYGSHAVGAIDLSDKGGKALHGESRNGIGVYGKSNNSYAGFFEGPVKITEVTEADGGVHYPLDPPDVIQKTAFTSFNIRKVEKLYLAAKTNTTENISVMCPAGHMVLGGGWDHYILINSNKIRIPMVYANYNGPIIHGQGWEVGIANPSPFLVHVNVMAICARVDE